ncbi:EpsG family protein [Apibacter raozihei]|uniref:EpsG family protein n=1 Tax=Apibacter raozihei TaxID=2500547 RepID=UPI000FE3DCAC|nr:EpsG family protein [Apibacter raozihei]
MLHPIYYIILFVFVFLTYIEQSNQKGNLKGIYIFSVIILILMSGLRVAQGADYWPYLELYKGSNKYIKWDEVFKADIEPSYIIVSKILGKLHLPFFALLTVFATFSISLKSYIFYKYSPLPMLSLAFYFMPVYFFEDCGHVRQSAAIACCIYSYKFIADKKLLKFLFCILIGYYSHKTAVVFLPAYWIANANISTRQCYLILISSLILWPLEPYNWFGNLFESLTIDTVSGAFNSYKNLDELGLSINDIVKIIFIGIILFNDKYILENTKDTNYLKVRNLVIFYYFIFYSFRGNAIFSVRLPGVYGDFAILLIPMIIKYSKLTYRRLLYSYIIIYIFLISWRFWGNAQALGFNNFSNIFNTNYNLFYNTPNEFID